MKHPAATTGARLRIGSVYCRGSVTGAFPSPDVKRLIRGSIDRSVLGSMLSFLAPWLA